MRQIRSSTVAGAYAMLLLAAGCGSSDGDRSSQNGGAVDNGAIDDGASVDNGGTGDNGGDTGGGGASERTFDPSLLPTTPVNPVLLVDNGLGGSGGGSAVPSNTALDLESIVDECSVIDGATVTTIMSNANTLGSRFDFVQETTPRSSCLFRSDTHLVEIFIHKADSLDDDFMQALNWLGGEISTRPGGRGGGATLYSEDSIDIVTLYAARAERNGWAVVVSNAGGTGMLVGDEAEEGWGDLALAALDSVADLNPDNTAPPNKDESPDATPGEGPCGVYAPEDLAGAFATDFVEENAGIATECLWRSSDGLITIALQVGPSDQGPDWFGEAEAVGNDVYNSEFGNEAFYAGNGQLYRLSVYVRTEAYGLGPYEYGGVRDRDTQPMVDALVANLIERTS